MRCGGAFCDFPSLIRLDGNGLGIAAVDCSVLLSFSEPDPPPAQPWQGHLLRVRLTGGVPDNARATWTRTRFVYVLNNFVLDCCLRAGTTNWCTHHNLSYTQTSHKDDFAISATMHLLPWTI